MSMKYRDDLTDSVGLLISILVCYPGICTVRYLPAHQSLKFAYIIGKVISTEEFDKLSTTIKDSLRILSDMIRKQPVTLQVGKIDFNGVTTIEIECEIEYITREDISLINDLVLQSYADSLIMEVKESLQEDEIFFQETVIENMLENIRDSAPKKYLIGFREEGRVMVYNK